jgi:hypothetical protein
MWEEHRLPQGKRLRCGKPMRNDLQREGFHIDVSLQEGNLAKNIYIYLFIYVFIYLFIYIQHFLTVNIYLVI